MLCAEGLSRALRIFLGLDSTPQFSFSVQDPPLTITVEKETTQIRPFVVAAVLRNVTLNEESLNSLIDLQDKLHQNICRKRTLVAIGTHDLDTVKGPFRYRALDPKTIQFAPLDHPGQVFTADKLMEYYETEPKVKHIKPYVPIIKNSPVYPIIYDSQDIVLSLPPIINGDHSKLTVNTKNIFIECTATDYAKALIVLNMIITSFSEYCQTPFTVEPVRVVYENEESWKRTEINISNRFADVSIWDELNNRGLLTEKGSINIEIPDGEKLLQLRFDINGHKYDIYSVTEISQSSLYQEYKSILDRNPLVNKSQTKATLERITPDLSTTEFTCDISYINSRIGITISAEEAARLLNKMQLKAIAKGELIYVTAPPTRADVLHPCDIMEDVAIAFGYNNIQKSIPKTITTGGEDPINKLSDMMRIELANSGFIECLTLALCSLDENFKFLNLKDDGSAVKVDKPKTREFQCCRTSLLVGLLKSLAHNLKFGVPLKIFEVSDVILRTDKTDTGAVNRRHLAVAYAGTTSGFEVVHGILDSIMGAIGVEWEAEKGYRIKESNHPTYLPMRHADVLYQGKKIGDIGIIHPEVIGNFNISFPVSFLEFDLQAIHESK